MGWGGIHNWTQQLCSLLPVYCQTYTISNQYISNQYITFTPDFFNVTYIQIQCHNMLYEKQLSLLPFFLVVHVTHDFTYISYAMYINTIAHRFILNTLYCNTSQPCIIHDIVNNTYYVEWCHVEVSVRWWEYNVYTIVKLWYHTISQSYQCTHHTISMKRTIVVLLKWRCINVCTNLFFTFIVTCILLLHIWWHAWRRKYEYLYIKY